VGLNTVKKDNPKLTARLDLPGIPYRIILDENLEIPLNSNVLSDEFTNKTILFTTPNHNSEVKEKLLQKGVKINIVNGNGTGIVNLHDVVSNLGKMGITSVLVEGGSKVFTHFIKEALFDKISIFIAPKLIGKGIDAIGDLGSAKISDALNLQNVTFRQINNQLLVEGYRDVSSTFGKLTGVI
jgi:diaminohydroxyphosphoribosylaminopyrimidine deaminase/5-amino-6-(5-phosphoribosylamino)uracil reductase